MERKKRPKKISHEKSKKYPADTGFSRNQEIIGLRKSNQRSKKEGGIMEEELDIHRFRVGNYLPRPIKSIAVESVYSNKIAVGREDGQIEVHYFIFSSVVYCCFRFLILLRIFPCKPEYQDLLTLSYSRLSGH
jgi:hypothetical protein